jgi:hypothetical protein
MTHRIMTTETNFKTTESQPLANAVFAHCQSQRDRQTQLAKSKNSSRTALFTNTKGSMQLYKFPTTSEKENKNSGCEAPAIFITKFQNNY